MTAIIYYDPAAPTPTELDKTIFYLNTVDIVGTAVKGAQVIITGPQLRVSSGAVIDPTEKIYYTDEAGYIEVSVIRGFPYKVAAPSLTGAVVVEIDTTSLLTANLAEYLTA